MSSFLLLLLADNAVDGHDRYDDDDNDDDDVDGDDDDIYDY